MKRKGFTLIELIVVIAIIGVLAAIMIPAMIGYVRRSKITSANTAAKSLCNGANIAMVEMETIDLPPQKLQGQLDPVTGEEVYACKDVSPHATDDKDELTEIFFGKICHYFSDVKVLTQITFLLDGYTCQAVGVMRGRYPGSYPQAISPQDYSEVVREGKIWCSDIAVQFATHSYGVDADENNNDS